MSLKPIKPSKVARNLRKQEQRKLARMQAITTGTMSAEAYKLFAGVTPETLEQFGEMLGLKSEGNEAQDKAFQEFLKLTKNNHSAMKRMIHRQGIAGFSQDVGRVVASFVYSNARAGAMGLNAGKMDKAIGEIPQEQGELKDLAMGLRSYIRDPQEEGQALHAKRCWKPSLCTPRPTNRSGRAVPWAVRSLPLKLIA